MSTTTPRPHDTFQVVEAHRAPSGKVTKWAVRNQTTGETDPATFRTKKAAERHCNVVIDRVIAGEPSKQAPAKQAQPKARRQPGSKGTRRTAVVSRQGYDVKQGLARVQERAVEIGAADANGKGTFPLRRRDLTDEQQVQLGTSILEERFVHGASWADYRALCGNLCRGMDSWAYRELFQADTGRWEQLAAEAEAQAA